MGSQFNSYSIYQNLGLSSLLLFEFIKSYQKETKSAVPFEKLLVVLPFCYTEAIAFDAGSRANGVKGLLNLIDDHKILFQSLPQQVTELYDDLIKIINLGVSLSVLSLNKEEITISFLKTNKKFNHSNKEMYELIKASRKLAKWISKLTNIEYISFFNLK